MCFEALSKYENYKMFSPSEFWNYLRCVKCGGIENI